MTQACGHRPSRGRSTIPLPRPLPRPPLPPPPSPQNASLSPSLSLSSVPSSELQRRALMHQRCLPIRRCPASPRLIRSSIPSFWRGGGVEEVTIAMIQQQNSIVQTLVPNCAFVAIVVLRTLSHKNGVNNRRHPPTHPPVFFVIIVIVAFDTVTEMLTVLTHAIMERTNRCGNGNGSAMTKTRIRTITRSAEERGIGDFPRQPVLIGDRRRYGEHSHSRRHCAHSLIYIFPPPPSLSIRSEMLTTAERRMLVSRALMRRALVRQRTISSPPHGPPALPRPCGLRGRKFYPSETPNLNGISPFFLSYLSPPIAPNPTAPPLPCHLIHNLPTPYTNPPPPYYSPFLLISCQPSVNFRNDEFSSLLFFLLSALLCLV